MAVKNPRSDTRHGRCHNFSIIPYQKICGTSVSPTAISSVASGTRQATSGIKKPSVVAGMATFVSYKVTYLNCLFLNPLHSPFVFCQANQYPRACDTIGGLPEPGQTLSYQIGKDGNCSVTRQFSSYSKDYNPLEKELLDELYSRSVRRISKRRNLSFPFFCLRLALFLFCCRTRYWSHCDEGSVVCVAEYQMSYTVRKFLQWKWKLRYYIDIADLVSKSKTSKELNFSAKSLCVML